MSCWGRCLVLRALRPQPELPPRSYKKPKKQPIFSKIVTTPIAPSPCAAPIRYIYTLMVRFSKTIVYTNHPPTRAGAQAPARSAVQTFLCSTGSLCRFSYSTIRNDFTGLAYYPYYTSAKTCFLRKLVSLHIRVSSVPVLRQEYPHPWLLSSSWPSCALWFLLPPGCGQRLKRRAQLLK